MTMLPAPTGQPMQEITTSLPGPTGESNRLSQLARPPLLCLGPGPQAVVAQARAVHALGGTAIEATGPLDMRQLLTMEGTSGVIWWGDETTAREIESWLARRNGPILPLIPGLPDKARVQAERHVCVDTTAAGGNAALLGGMG